MAAPISAPQFEPGRFAIAPDMPHVLGPTIIEVANELLTAKGRANRSDRYLWQLQHCYTLFSGSRRRRPLGSITTREIEDWLHHTPGAARTRKGRIQYLRLLYKFAQDRNYVSRNPALAVDFPAPDPHQVSVHTPAQVRAVLAAALKHHPGVAKALAIRYFAGLRSCEVARLDPKLEIHLERRRIEVTAAKAKTRRRRFVTIQDNLLAWLQLEEAIPGDLEKRITLCWQAAGVPWPRNAARHSFCSYHLAHFQNAARTALEAGHSEQMLFGVYRDLVTPEEAAEYWEIKP
jgi:hypothetical protein